MSTQPIQVYARRRGRVPSSLSHLPPQAMVEFYDIALSPESPLRTGMRIEILLVEPCEAMFPADAPAKRRYVASATGVEGVIIASKPVEGSIVELTVKNENDASDVAYAHLTVEHEQGVTTLLAMGERLLSKIVAYLYPATRTVVAVRNAAVYRSGRRHAMAGPM